MNNPIENKKDSKIRSGSDNFFENQIIFCPETDNLDSSLSQLKKKSPRLIIHDISHNFYPPKVQLIPNRRFKGKHDWKSTLIYHDENSLDEFLNQITNIFKISRSVLRLDGFLAVKVNGSIKSFIKKILDTIFHQENFMNEIILNSPIQIHYSKESAYFERTDYFLLYSSSNPQKINPVYDEKESGGYWHSFVSQGQGSPKNFLINGKMVLLNPPSGTHWKLKQESILELCKKGQIRLNRRGNPEYWVPPKIGQIIDTNWLDLNILAMRKGKDRSSYYMRLFQVLLTSNQLVVIINPRDVKSLIEASNFDLNWICLVEDKKTVDILKSELIQENVNYSVGFAQNSKVSHLDLYKIPLLEEQIEELSLYNEKISKLKPVSMYSNDSNKEIQAENELGNILIQGDCLYVLRLLQTEYHQAIKLIYIDPPFYTGTNELLYIPVQKRDNSNVKQNNKSDISIKTVAYENVFTSNTPIEDFKLWFRKRIILMRSLLRPDGCIFVRFDYHFGHYAREVLNDIFGQENFEIEFIIRRMKKNLSEKQLNQQTHLIVHSDSLFVYRGSKQAKLRHEMIKKSSRKGQDKAEIEYSHDNLWIDIAGYQKVKRTLYPTENSEVLLKRIIEISTSKGDIIADFFAGSGTTLAMAEQHERKWLGIDIGILSINEIRKRLLKIEGRKPFTFHELILKPNNRECDKNRKFGFNINVSKRPVAQGTEIVLTLINLLHTPLLSELQHYSYLDLIDYWEIDWYYNKSMANIGWYSYRQIIRKEVEKTVAVSACHEYSHSGEYNIWINVIDIFGNSHHKTIKIDLL